MKTKNKEKIKIGKNFKQIFSTSQLMPHTSQRGITLIALVITIIIMLILAGVTINLALGDNGLIGYARNAKDETKKAEEKEISEQEEAILKIKAMQEIKVADVDEEPGV